MKRIGFILLMMLLPLQSAWAAVHLYHSHDSSSSLIEAVFHDHADSEHGHSHTHGEPSHHEESSSDQSDASDHHHFHVHSLSVLSNEITPHFPSPSAVHHSHIPALQEAIFPQRIERPNWR